MRGLGAGDAIRDGRYRVHSRFAHAVNYTDGRRWVFMVGPEIGDGPLNLVVDEPARAGDDLDVGPQGYAMGAWRWMPPSSGQRYRSRLPRQAVNVEVVKTSLPAFARALAAEAPIESMVFLLDPSRRLALARPSQRATVERAERGVAALRAGRIEEGVGLLRGCGPGLTPAGDDFLAGALYAPRVLGMAPDRRLQAAIGHREHSLSAAFLDLARRGLFPVFLKALALALRKGDHAGIERETARTIAHGATSGADLGTGLCWALAYKLGVQVEMNPIHREAVNE